MSRSLHRARPQTDEPATSAAMARTASKSPTEAIGNPASMTSTPSAASARAISSFSAMFMLAPGDCSPSRRVVSKIRTRFDSGGSLRRRIRRRGRAHGSALSSVFGVDLALHWTPDPPMDGTEARKTRSPEIHRSGGSRGFVGCVRIRTQRTLRPPPSPPDQAKAEAEVESKDRRETRHRETPWRVEETQPSIRIIRQAVEPGSMGCAGRTPSAPYSGSCSLPDHYPGTVAGQPETMTMEMELETDGARDRCAS